MKPDAQDILNKSADQLMGQLAPALSATYSQGAAAIMALLMKFAAKEYERGADIRVTENTDIRALFADIAPRVGDAALRKRLEDAAATRDTSLAISALNTANDELRRTLIALQVWVEESGTREDRTTHLVRVEGDGGPPSRVAVLTCRADAPWRRRPSAFLYRSRCRSVSSIERHGRAVPELRADRRRPRADAWRRNGATHAVSRVPRDPAGCASAASMPAPRARSSACRAATGTKAHPARRRTESFPHSDRSASRTAGNTGTMRSLRPLPTMFSDAPNGTSLRRNPSASEMRNPQP